MLMKRLLTLIAIVTLFMSCKPETKEQAVIEKTISEEKKELTVADKIALAHGFEHWKDVSSIAFTFGVQRNGKGDGGRSWTWFPKKDSIILKSKKQNVTYARSRMDSVSMKADPVFINDKFWMLIPFQLVWDEGTTLSETVKTVAPISKSEMNKITIVYGDEGGYTPGDAYDIFFDDDYIIREWVFRKGNVVESTMSTTFENYENFNGIKIAKDHKMPTSDFNIVITNVKVN